MFQASCTDANNFLRQYTTKDETDVYEFLKTQGMQVNLTPDIESFRVATASVIDKEPGSLPAGARENGPATPA